MTAGNGQPARERPFLDMALRTSPHLSAGDDVPRIMRTVLLALAPAAAVAVYAFGVSVLLLLAVTTGAALLTERVACHLTGQPQSLGDYSAAITGVLLGLTLPPGFPLWMAVVGAVVSIGIGKLIFGGLGFNLFNPALVGRAFLQAAFPTAITTWGAPFLSQRFTTPVISSLALPFLSPPDALSSATPLALTKFDGVATDLWSLATGSVAGSSGETSAVVILLCGVYLAQRQMLDWRIPVGILATVAILSGVVWLLDPSAPTPLFMLLSGGVMLAAVFMATDMVTSPVTALGVWLFAVLIGAITVVIRLWGGLAEGVMYAILLGNALTPLLNLITQPRVYGTRGRPAAPR